MPSDDDDEEAEMNPLPAERSIGILGPVTLVVDKAEVSLGPLKQRAVLAALLCDANSVVPVERMIAAVWEERQPRTARKNLHVYLTALRKILGGGISFHGYGYRLAVGPEECDLFRFDALAAAGRTALRDNRFGQAVDTLEDALALWRDHAFADLLGFEFAAAESARLSERYLDAVEDWAEASLAVEAPFTDVDRLVTVAMRNPLRERITRAVMRALARSGQREAALGFYD